MRSVSYQGKLAISCSQNFLVICTISWRSLSSRMLCMQSGRQLTTFGGNLSNPSARFHRVTLQYIFFFLVSYCGVRLSPLGTSATIWPVVPAPDDRWWVWSSRWNEDCQEKPKYSEKTCPSATCPPQIPHDLGSNPSRRGGKPATNRLSYGTTSLQSKCGGCRILHIIGVSIRIHGVTSKNPVILIFRARKPSNVNWTSLLLLCNFYVFSLDVGAYEKRTWTWELNSLL
jgi:hypothetical protein